MRITKLLGCILGLFISLSAAAHAANGGKIVFINPGTRGEVFWENVTSAMSAAADQLGFELEVKWAERNKLNMQSLGINAVKSAEKPDYIILVNEERAAIPILVEAERAGVKTLFLSNPPITQEYTDYSKQHGELRHVVGAVVADMTNAGYRMAQALVEEADRRKLHGEDGKLHLLAIAGDEISPSSSARNQGLLAYVSTRDDIVIERMLYANWNENEARTLTSRFLELAKRKQQNVAGVWAANDPMAIGAISVLEDAGIVAGQDTVVVGMNWSPEAISKIRDGKLLMSDGGHFLLGGWIIVALADHIKGCPFANGSPNKHLTTPTAAIDSNTDPALLELLTKREFGSIDYTQFLTHSTACGSYDFGIDAIVKATRKK